jgi:hypothetical protein
VSLFVHSFRFIVIVFSLFALLQKRPALVQQSILPMLQKASDLFSLQTTRPFSAINNLPSASFPDRMRHHLDA